ncbi:hypothetical protein [Actinoplanes sp. NPDC026619]|uniref:hypothetical protein n=1 Tax=Actinoplanes sp. NPDC026619 TaxID=3155798 RepID=UPI0033C2F638
MGDYLTASSVLMCPHGGSVSPVAGNTVLTLGGTAILLSDDSFPIGGCAFAPSAPHPCVQVEWMVTAQRAAAGGAAPLTTDSVGLCKAADGAPQGPVQIQTTQPTVGGS